MAESAHIPIVPAVWADFYKETRIPAALRVGETLRVTGHTGETAESVFSTDPESQIRQVFRNIAHTLDEAGANWSNVVELNSYHVGLVQQSEALLRVAAEFPRRSVSSVDSRGRHRAHLA